MPGIGLRRGRLLIGTLLVCMPTLPAQALEYGRALIDAASGPYRLNVEIARTAQEKAQGLMARHHLDADAGMLFVYTRQQPPEGDFWMYRTRIALDIAFLDATGTIRALYTMLPCASEQAAHCPTYRAGVPYHAALEVNAGYFAAHDIHLGDRVVLSGTANSANADANTDR